MQGVCSGSFSNIAGHLPNHGNKISRHGLAIWEAFAYFDSNPEDDYLSTNICLGRNHRLEVLYKCIWIDRLIDM